MSIVPQIPLKEEKDTSTPSGAGDQASAPLPRTEFMRSSRGIALSGWRPQLRDASDDVGSAWDLAAARSIDLAQNNGWISGMVDQAAANTVGEGLRLRAMPENDLFGMDEELAQEWRNLVERKFGLYAENPIEIDIEGRRSFGQMQDAALRCWVATGEVLAELPYRRRFGSRTGTKVRLISPHRLSRRTEKTRRLVNGVRMDADNFPIAYLALRDDPLLGQREIEVPARDRFGRPRVVHIYIGMPGQFRGITPLVPALKVAKQFDQLADATLMASLMQSVFAGSLTSDAPTEEMLEGLMTPEEQSRMRASGASPFDAWFAAQEGWYESSSIDVGISGRIAHLFPGQKMEFHSPEQPTPDYKAFALHLLRELARCLGLTYESATGDYEGATYSSVRMAVNEIFTVTKVRRKNVVAPFCQAIYEAWLEEQVQTGAIWFPGGYAAFLRNREAACRAAWRGAPKPVADDLKAQKAHEGYQRMGVITDEAIATDLGLDIEDVYAQRAREQAMRRRYGLPESPSLVGHNGGPALDDPEDPEESDAD